MKYQYLLFDADDTLFDFQLAQDRSLNEVFTKVGIDLKEKATYKKISHGLWDKLEKKEITLTQLKEQRFTLLLEALHMTCDEDVEMLYENTLASHDELLVGAKEFLDNVKNNFHLILISNGMPNIQHPRLISSGLEDYFEHIFISDEIGAQKPSKEFFDIVFDTIKAKKEDCLVIGDGLTSDILGGHNYGIDTCFFNPNKKVSDLPTYDCENYQEILKILKQKEPL